MPVVEFHIKSRTHNQVQPRLEEGVGTTIDRCITNKIAVGMGILVLSMRRECMIFHCQTAHVKPISQRLQYSILYCTQVYSAKFSSRPEK